LLGHRQRVKTEIEENSYEAAHRVKSFKSVSRDRMMKHQHVKLETAKQKHIEHKKRMMQHSLDHKMEKTEKHEMFLNSKKINIKVRKFKISFAEECYPIQNRISERVDN